MTLVTFAALVIKIVQLGGAISQPGNALQLVFAVLVSCLGFSIVWHCVKALRAPA
jgi:hypothetical protein